MYYEIHSITTDATHLQISALLDKEGNYTMASLQKILSDGSDIAISMDLPKIYEELFNAVANKNYKNLDFINTYHEDYKFNEYQEEYIRLNNLKELEELLEVFNRAKELLFF